MTVWVEEPLEPPPPPLTQDLRDAIGRRQSSWPGPAVEHRPEPIATEQFIPTVRDRIKPTDLGSSRKLALSAFVHRFTAASMQALSAIGATSAYLKTERRG